MTRTAKKIERIFMKRTNISSGSPFESVAGFSRAVRVGNIISVAGTAPIAADGSTAAPGDAYGQTLRCFEIIGQAITEAGGNIQNVVRTRIMMTDISRWKDAAKAHGEIFASIRPACTLVEVSGLIEKDWLVEIEADCILPG
jgi:enamine deaminase RidA (YjgF/YER057c/UK114 family)